MTREEARDILKNKSCVDCVDRCAYPLENQKGYCEYADAISMAIEALEAQRWISVSEEPKASGYYNCTCYDGVTHRVTTLKWSNGWMLSGRRAYWKVLAWMPLPKPYTEDSDEK